MLPKDLGGFTLEQLRGFATVAKHNLAALQEAKPDTGFTAEQVAELEELAAAQSAISERIAELEAEAADAAAADAADAAVDAAADAPDEDEDAENTEGDDAPEGDADVDAVVDEAVASARLGGGDSPRVTVGDDRSRGDEVKKFLTRVNHGTPSPNERHAFTTMRRETLHVVKAGQNATEAIRQAVADRKAGTDKTAAGCFCGPDDALTAIKSAHDTVRPLSDTLPTITASGDVRYVRQISLEDALAGVTQWTCTDQDNVDPDVTATWKPCFELDCEEEQTSAMYAVAACASFNVQQFIGNPTLVDNLQHVMEVAYNKTAELLVYQALKALTSQYTFGLAPSTGYGASAQLLAAVGWAMELIHASLRETDPSYTLALPAGVVDRVITDGVIRGMDEYRVRDDLFDRLATLGVSNVVEMVDEITGGLNPPAAHEAPGDPDDGFAAAAPHPTIQEIVLYRPEDFVLGVGPDVDLGVQRSPELARQNKMQWFTESFEFVEKLGVAPALTLQVPLCVSGTRPALAEGNVCNDDGEGEGE